jgi:hypothetical protein
MPEEENNDSLEQEVDETIEHVEEQLDTDKPLTLAHLQELEKRINDRVDGVVSSTTADANEKAELKAELKKVQEQLAEMIKVQEERDKKHSDESTIIVPPEDLDPTINRNPLPEEESSTGEDEPPKKKQRLRWY